MTGKRGGGDTFLTDSGGGGGYHGMVYCSVTPTTKTYINGAHIFSTRLLYFLGWNRKSLCVDVGIWSYISIGLHPVVTKGGFLA